MPCHTSCHLMSYMMSYVMSIVMWCHVYHSHVMLYVMPNVICEVMLYHSMFYFMPYLMPFMSVTLNRKSWMVGLIMWFNPSKPGPLSRALCDTVFAFSIVNRAFLNWPIVSLLILFYFILFSNILLWWGVVEKQFQGPPRMSRRFSQPPSQMCEDFSQHPPPSPRLSTCTIKLKHIF